jgi:hypothetical protein
MKTLVLNAPSWRENEDGAKSFHQILATGRGDGYAMPAHSWVRSTLGAAWWC